VGSEIPKKGPDVKRNARHGPKKTKTPYDFKLGMDNEGSRGSIGTYAGGGAGVGTGEQ
jgi:hypothetical protein